MNSVGMDMIKKERSRFVNCDRIRILSPMHTAAVYNLKRGDRMGNLKLWCRRTRETRKGPR